MHYTKEKLNNIISNYNEGVYLNLEEIDGDVVVDLANAVLALLQKVEVMEKSIKYDISYIDSQKNKIQECINIVKSMQSDPEIKGVCDVGYRDNSIIFIKDGRATIVEQPDLKTIERYCRQYGYPVDNIMQSNIRPLGY